MVSASIWGKPPASVSCTGSGLDWEGETGCPTSCQVACTWKMRSLSGSQLS